MTTNVTIHKNMLSPAMNRKRYVKEMWDGNEGGDYLTVDVDPLVAMDDATLSYIADLRAWHMFTGEIDFNKERWGQNELMAIALYNWW